MGTFGFGLPPRIGQQQGGGFQLGQSNRQVAPLPVGAAPNLATSLGQGGGIDPGSILALLQSIGSQAPQNSPVFQGGLGLTTPLSNTGRECPPGTIDAQGLCIPDIRPPLGGGNAPSRKGSTPNRSSGAAFQRNTPEAFQGGITGNTLTRAQEIARLVGGTVGSQGVEDEGQFISDTQRNRVDTTIMIDGRPFSFTQLENALVNRGTAGLANTLALGGGITNQFTNDNATAGRFGRF